MCTNLEQAIAPDSVKYIGFNAFSNCIKLTNINLGANLIEIEYNAFFYCQELQEITIPQNVIHVGQDAFANCDKLSKVYWNAIQCEYAGNWTNPIFNSRKYVNIGKEIIIGDMVKKIPPYTFYLKIYSTGAPVSTSVIIPGGVEELGEDSFLGFSGYVYYCGTEEQWEKLYYINSADFSTSNIYYYSGSQPAENDKFWHYDSDNNPTVWYVK